MNRIYIVCLWIFMVNFASSQDFHFSQFYASPLTTNPALTGNFNGLCRVSTNYRMQWDNVSTATYLYQTPSASAEVNFIDKNMSLGLVFVNDQTNNKLFNTLEGGLSFAYKINVEKFQFSLGLQGWFNQLYYDWAKLSQNFNNSDASLATSNSNFDFNTGIFTVYSLPDDRSKLFGGVSVFHLLQPKYQGKISALDFAQPIKYAAHAGADIALGERYRLIPGAFYAYQDKASQTNLGMSIGYRVLSQEYDDANSDITLFVGAWTRINELEIQSFIPKFGIEYNRVRGTISYDFVTNGLNSASARPNTFELSLGFVINERKKSKDFGCYSPW